MRIAATLCALALAGGLAACGPDPEPADVSAAPDASATEPGLEEEPAEEEIEGGALGED